MTMQSGWRWIHAYRKYHWFHEDSPMAVCGRRKSKTQWVVSPWVDEDEKCLRCQVALERMANATVAR